MYRYIAIEGNIGAGKTSLATRLASDFEATLILEEFADNPFLPKFYEQPDRYAFPLELSFLSERFSQLKKELMNRDLFSPVVIADYFISKSHIFAKNNLLADEYELFLKVFNIVEPTIPKPELLVYLYAEVEKLQENIRTRNREYELKITNKYLADIQKRYMTFMRQHKKLRILIVHTATLDFVNREEDYQKMKAIVTKSYPRGITRIEM